MYHSKAGMDRSGRGTEGLLENMAILSAIQAIGAIGTRSQGSVVVRGKKVLRLAHSETNTVLWVEGRGLLFI